LRFKVHIGLTHKEIHDAREVRDAEAAEPGIVQKTVDGAVAAGEEPTKAEVKRAVRQAAGRTKKGVTTQSDPEQPEVKPDRVKEPASVIDALTTLKVAYDKGAMNDEDVAHSIVKSGFSLTDLSALILWLDILLTIAMPPKPNKLEKAKKAKTAVLSWVDCGASRSDASHHDWKAHAPHGGEYHLQARWLAGGKFTGYAIHYQTMSMNPIREVTEELRSGVKDLEKAKSYAQQDADEHRKWEKPQ
jgi:hypothetical protein